MPKARAPKAPWVAVWLSPQTTVIPGWVAPISGPNTWTTPCCGSPSPWSSIPNSFAFFSIWATCASFCASKNGQRPSGRRGSVGVEWSVVARVRSGRRTLSPRSRSMEKACGLVTSCIRWRSM